MAIYLPGTAEDQPVPLEEMTPREIVVELDKYVVGQAAAKRAVAIALRNRQRRQKLSPELAEEIMPKNILMIGSTGVGKTEIARRLAKLTGSPFLKVEASKFTEVGYIGRDVESIVRDLAENAIDMVREEKLDEVEDRADLAAEEKLLDLLVAQSLKQQVAMQDVPLPEAESMHETGDATLLFETIARFEASPVQEAVPQPPAALGPAATPFAERRERDRLRQHFREGKLDDQIVELETRERNVPQVEVYSNQQPEENDSTHLKDMLQQMFANRTRRRPMKVSEAFDYLVGEEEQRLLDMDQVTRVALERVENSGIVFLDEIDKIAGREGGHGPDISREGVQRDILPIVEGTTVSTKYGPVATDHILFIAAGAFHVSKPSDLIPELQGRFPIRVELQSLAVEDFLRILTEPRASLVKQSIALLETEGLTLEFSPDALDEMARFAFEVNETTENIGARRLHTIMERVLDEISFEAPDLMRAFKKGEPVPENKLPAIVECTSDKGLQHVLTVSRDYVQQQVAGIVKNQDLSRYIL
ncbi:MAG: ATP-dependent protease ATPase subunit HslU [Acidobacteriaceae bacterium]|nr:ATP-dependent protease ATPase subunit HslU [Acidobacteriaceae bacterium]